MEGIVKFFRDSISGFYYFVYAGILLFFIFAIIGYLVTEKYQPSKPKDKKKDEQQPVQTTEQVQNVQSIPQSQSVQQQVQ